MSEPSNEQTDSTETPDVGLVTDEELPEDLQPGKNPLAADPEEPEEPGA